MTFNEWKPKLIPIGVLLVCYFVVPGIVGMFMGENNAIFGRFTFSLIVQAGLGFALVYKFLELKQPLNGELAAWLVKFSQPPEKTREFAEKISLALVVILIIATVGPLAGEIILGQLLTLIKVSALVYVGYMAYNIWQLAEPFMAYDPATAPLAVPAALPAAVTERRCVKCGQRIDDSMKLCAFCGQPIASGFR